LQPRLSAYTTLGKKIGLTILTRTPGFSGPFVIFKPTNFQEICGERRRSILAHLEPKVVSVAAMAGLQCSIRDGRWKAALGR
jgi:hypothetical protein